MTIGLQKIATWLADFTQGRSILIGTEHSSTYRQPAGIYYVIPGGETEKISGATSWCASSEGQVLLIPPPVKQEQFGIPQLYDCRTRKSLDVNFAISGPMPAWCERRKMFAFCGQPRGSPEERDVWIYDIEAGGIPIRCGCGAAKALSWSGDDSELWVVAFGSAGATIESFDVKGHRLRQAINVSASHIWGCNINSSGTHVAFYCYSESGDVELRVLDISNRTFFVLSDVDFDVTPLWGKKGNLLFYYGYESSQLYLRAVSAQRRKVVFSCPVETDDSLGERPLCQPFMIDGGEYIGVIVFKAETDAILVADLSSHGVELFQSDSRLNRIVIVK